MSYNTKSTLNQGTILGRIGNDLNLKKLSNDGAALKLSVATERSYKDSNGAKKNIISWHRVVLYNKLAEIIAQYSKKGDRIIVTGYLETRSWEADGQKKYMTEIIADSCQILESTKKSNDSSPSATPPPDDDIGQDENGNDLPF